MIITKMNFMRGMQCPRMLWLDKHKPELKTIPTEVQRRLDRGNEFGDLAIGMFGDYVEMTAYQQGTTFLDIFRMVENTRAHLMKGTTVICEAAFLHNQAYCAADILRKVGNGYELYEVKDATEVEGQFLKDVSFQANIITKCGVHLSRICIVYHGNSVDTFAIEDVTIAAKKYFSFIEKNIDQLKVTATQQNEPILEIGRQCHEPYECWYFGYCNRCQNHK